MVHTHTHTKLMLLTCRGSDPNLRISSQLDIKFPSRVNLHIFIKFSSFIGLCMMFTMLKETESSCKDGNILIHR